LCFLYFLFLDFYFFYFFLSGLIGNGLYGVDLKQNDHGIFVIEINDNPNIDTGVEDLRLKDELYKIIVREFIRRLDGRTNGEAARG